MSRTLSGKFPKPRPKSSIKVRYVTQMAVVIYRFYIPVHVLLLLLGDILILYFKCNRVQNITPNTHTVSREGGHFFRMVIELIG